jgi:hypothetical protein
MVRIKSIQKHYLVAALAIAVGAAPASAQAVEAQVSFTATAQNVTGAPDDIRIDLFRWSSDAEQEELLKAWAPPPPPAKPEAGGRGGRGGGRGGRGGRGGGQDTPSTPESRLSEALQKAPTVGYLWTSETAGYAIRSAVRVAQAGGGERILLLTGRRLGRYNNSWQPTGGAPASAHEFSVIELRVNAQGEGEGKASISGGVVMDDATKTIVVESYEALPVSLGSVKRRAS